MDICKDVTRNICLARPEDGRELPFKNERKFATVFCWKSDGEEKVSSLPLSQQRLGDR